MRSKPAETGGLDGALRRHDAVLARCSKLGRWQLALLCLEEMPSKDNFSFNAAIAACASACRWSLCAWLFELAAAAAAQPDTVSLNVVVKAGRCKDARAACGRAFASWFLCLIAATVVLPGSALLLYPAQACGSNSWSFALNWLQASESAAVRSDAISYTLAIQAGAGARQSESSGLALLGAALKKRIVAIGAAVASTRKWHSALTTLRSCDNLGLPAGVTAYNAALSFSPPWNGALSLLRHTARRVRRDIITFNSAASALQLNLWRQQPTSFPSQAPFHMKGPGCWASASSLLASSAAAAVQQDVISCDSMLGASTRSRVWEQTVRLLASLHLRAVRRDAALYSRCLFKGLMGFDWQLSVHLLQSTLQVALVPDETSYASALDAFANGWDAAIQLLMQPNSRRSAHAYASLLNLCDRVDWRLPPKPWQQALQLLGAARRDSAVDTFCANALINVCAKALQWQHALALLVELFGAEQLQQNIVSFNAVLDAARTARAWQLALGLQALLAAAAQEADIVSHVSALGAFYLASQWQVLVASTVPEHKGTVAETIWLSAWRTIDALGLSAREGHMADLLDRPIPHPCPRKLHHPGENCRCAERLKLLVPHGHSRSADLGSVHCARLQNLKWRLTAKCFRDSSAQLRLPASLRNLADDHKGDAACKSLRPLSPDKKRPARSVIHRRCAGRMSARAGSPEVIDFAFASPGSSGSSAKSSRTPRCVKFNEALNCEVPVLAVKTHDREEKMFPRILSSVDVTVKKEMLARRNLRAMTQNHRAMVKQCEECFEFVGSILWWHCVSRQCSKVGIMARRRSFWRNWDEHQLCSCTREPASLVGDMESPKKATFGLRYSCSLSLCCTGDGRPAVLSILHASCG
eukprot:s2183_g6.t11